MKQEWTVRVSKKITNSREAVVMLHADVLGESFAMQGGWDITVDRRQVVGTVNDATFVDTARSMDVSIHDVATCLATRYNISLESEGAMRSVYIVGMGSTYVSMHDYEVLPYILSSVGTPTE